VLDDGESLGEVEAFYDRAIEMGATNFLLAANKCDLSTDGYGRATEWARQSGIRAVKTSAMDGTNVANLLQAKLEIAASSQDGAVAQISREELGRMDRRTCC
jgi:50S ribosomal subunit-associated GTPase HflX